LVPLEEVVKDLPPYWVRLVNGTPIRETITDPDTGETVPRASEAQNLTPVSIKRLSPEYPTDLNDYSISGSVVLRVIVDEKGKTKVVDIVTPMGFGLDQAAIDAVHRWEYEPGQELFVSVGQSAFIPGEPTFVPQSTQATIRLGRTYRF